MLGSWWMVAAAATVLLACESGVDNASEGEGGSGSSGSGGHSAGTTGDIGAAGPGGAGPGGAGSGGSTGCEPPPNPDTFEMGTGEHCFARLSPNEAVDLISGPQGGYHVWLAIGCADCNSPLQVYYGVRDPSTGTILEGTYDSQSMVQLIGSPWAQAARIIVSMPGFEWDPETPPPPLGTPFVLWVEAREGGQVKHAAELQVVVGDTVQWDPCIENPEDPLCQMG